MIDNEAILRLEQKIDDRFDILHQAVVSFSKEQSRQGAEINNCTKDKDKIEEILHGNGREGLLIKVNTLHNTLKTKGFIKRDMWTNVGIIFMIVGVCASMFFSILNYNNSLKEGSNLVNKDFLNGNK